MFDLVEKAPPEIIEALFPLSLADKMSTAESNEPSTTEETTEPLVPESSPEKKIKNKKSIKNLFGLLSFKDKKSTAEEPRASDAVSRDSGSQERETSLSVSVEEGNVAPADLPSGDSLAPGTAESESSNVNSPSESASPEPTKKVPSALRRRSIQRVVSVRNAQTASLSPKPKADNNLSPIAKEDAEVATTAEVTEPAAPATTAANDPSVENEEPEVWEKKAEKNKQEAQTESLLSELQLAAGADEGEVWERKAAEKQAEEHTVKILRRLSQLDGSVAEAAAAAMANSALELEEDLYEEAWEKKLSAQAQEEEGEASAEEATAAQPDYPDESAGCEESHVVAAAEEVEAEETIPTELSEAPEEAAVAATVVETRDGRRLSIRALTPGAPPPPPPPSVEVEEEAPVSVVETSTGRRLSIRALTPGAPPPPPPPPSADETTPEAEEPAPEAEEPAPESEEPAPESEEPTPESEAESAPVTVVETTNGRRLSIRAMTPGAPPPPPPPPSHDEPAEDPAPVAVVETSNGRRLSIRAMTPGAPPPPPPPGM